MQLRAEATMTELRRSHHTQLSELRKRNSNTEAELADSRQAQKAAEARCAGLLDEERCELSSVKSGTFFYKDITHDHTNTLLLWGNGVQFGGQAFRR